LHLASCEGHIEVVKWLVQNGVEKNIKDFAGNKAVDDAFNHNKMDIY
jgi:hypothetical protein